MLQSVAEPPGYLPLFEFQPWATRILGSAYALSGDTERALRLIDEAVTTWTRLGCVPYLSERIGALGEVHLRAGRLQRAQDLAQSAIEAARVHGELPAEAQGLRLYSEVHAHGGEYGLAEERYSEALARPESPARRGGRLGRPRCR